MTLAFETPRDLFTGTGSTGPFAVSFYFGANAHVKVARQSASGTITVLAESTDYTLTGGPDSGSITLMTALAGGATPERLAIWREQPLAQNVDLSVADPYRSTVLEGALDTLTQINQELSQRLDRAVILPSTDSLGATHELPAATVRASKLLGFSSTGSLTVIDPDTLPTLQDGDLGVMPIISGGTGGTTAAEARTNLGIGTIGTRTTLQTSDLTTPHASINHGTIIATDLETNSAARLQNIGQWVVESATTTAAPSVTNGNAYLIPSDATGTWLAQIGKIAYGVSGSWTYKTPAKGWVARARDTDAEWYHDGSAWGLLTGSTGSSSTPTYASIDSRVAGYAKSNTQGGGAKFRVHWTTDQRIVAYGDNAGFAFDPTGDSWGPFEIPVPWDTSTITIENIYQGLNYILVQTDQSTGNLWHMGSSASGQGGMGGTTAATVLTRITTFTTDAVKISSVTTEANLGNTEAMWFAITTAGNVYSCGYSGAQHAQGYGSTTNRTTPRKMTASDGVTVITGITAVFASTAYAPVWALKSNGNALRWGAGTDGAHGNGNTTAIQWPTALETTLGSGVARTDIASVAVSGSSLSLTKAVTWLLTTAGKIEAAGSRTYGNGDGAALLGAASNTFQAASGTIASLTTTSIAAGGGETPVCIAITSTGNGYTAGYHAGMPLIGSGATTNLNTFTILSGLPSGFAGALTKARICGCDGSGNVQAAYLEATISSVKTLASIGYDSNYATGKNITGTSAGSQTWGLVLGGRGTISDWQPVGGNTVYGIEVLTTDGELRYAGGNDQGQGGVQFGNIRSIPTLQTCRPAGPRLLKPPTWRGTYSGGTAYTKYDLAEDQGATWILTATTSTGNAPPTLPTTSNSYWTLVAAPGDDGVSLNWRGTWLTATAYAVQDGVAATVSSKIQSYVCILAHTSGSTTQPGVGASWATYWQLAAQAGADGSPGTAATIAVGTVTTGAAGTSASITNAGSSSAATFNFTIPRGDAGAAGATGAAAPFSLDYTWSTGTSGDPTSGKTGIDTATYASITSWRISETDRLGGDKAARIAVIDDSDSTTKAIVDIIDVLDPTKWLSFSITGTLTDNGSYDTFGSVTYIGAGSALTDGNRVSVIVSIVGKKGADGSGTGDVSSSSSFTTDNRLVRTDRPTSDNKNVQTSGITVDDSNNVSGVGTLASGAQTVTSASANALAVGANGTTNPVLKVDASTISVATGIVITGAAAAARVALAVLSSGANEGLSIDAKGSGTIRLGATSTGAIEFSRAAVPTTSDGVALGSATLMWSDLFLADGGVINWNNGNFTATHSAGLLTLSGALSIGISNAFTAGTIELGHATDTTVSRSAAGIIAVEGETVHTNSISRTLTAAGIELGHATDTTLSRSAAGRLAVEGKNALLLGQTDTLTAGYAATPYSAGTKSSGTYTPAESDGAFQYATNGGAHTLAPPANNTTICVQYTNNGTAGAITTSGFTKVSGSFTTTNGDDFMCFLTRNNGFTLLSITALQ